MKKNKMVWSIIYIITTTRRNNLSEKMLVVFTVLLLLSTGIVIRSIVYAIYIKRKNLLCARITIRELLDNLTN